MNITKKITLFLLSILFVQISADHGGAIAAGVIGGAALGTAIAASADRPVVVAPAYDPYYYDGPYVAPVVYEEGPYYGGYYEGGYRGGRYRGAREGNRGSRETRGGRSVRK